MNTWKRLCRRWSKLVFSDRFNEITPKIRMFRLVEEVFELAQAEGVTEAELDALKRQVYDKPANTPCNEFGGVLVCLAAYADTRHYDLEEAFWDEFERIMDPAMMEKVRRRNLEGDKIGFAKTPEPA